MRKYPIFLFSLLPLFLFPSCKKGAAEAQGFNPQAAGPVEVNVITSEAEQLPVNTRLPGRLEPYRQAEVRARVTGIVLKRCYEEGQSVKEGDLLFKIDPAPLKANLDACDAALARAEAILKDAQDKLNRHKDLVEKGAISKREHNLSIAEEAQASAEKKSAQAAREKALLELGYADVISPISGTARRALVTEGAYVNQNESTHLTTVEQINPIFVRFSQPSTELSARQRSILSGQWEGIPLEEIKVHLILPDGRTYPEPGKLFFSDRAVDPQTDTVEMRAEFPNAHLELLPGAYVRVSFDSAVRKNVFRIPRDSVSRTSQGASVFVVNDQNILEIRPVQTELLEGLYWIVTGGLKGGERIVTSKLSGLFPGMPAKISQQPSGQAGQNTAESPSPAKAVEQPAKPEQNQ